MGKNETHVQECGDRASLLTLLHFLNTNLCWFFFLAHKEHSHFGQSTIKLLGMLHLVTGALISNILVPHILENFFAMRVYTYCRTLE